MLYARVSTAIQVDGYSLDAQRDKLTKYAEYQYQESEKDECVIEVWNCIIDAVAYICRKIYEEQGADYFPEPIELVDEDTYSRLIAGYEKCMQQ